jgi:hypothetical protein
MRLCFLVLVKMRGHNLVMCSGFAVIQTLKFLREKQQTVPVMNFYMQKFSKRPISVSLVYR